MSAPAVSQFEKNWWREMNGQQTAAGEEKKCTKDIFLEKRTLRRAGTTFLHSVLVMENRRYAKYVVVW